MNPPHITPDTIVSRSADILASDLDQQTVMVDIQNGNYYGLGETGSRIWQLIESPISISSLCEALIEEFAIDLQQCLSDTIDFIATLAKKEIVELNHR